MRVLPLLLPRALASARPADPEEQQPADPTGGVGPVPGTLTSPRARLDAVVRAQAGSSSQAFSRSAA